MDGKKLKTQSWFFGLSMMMVMIMMMMMMVTKAHLSFQKFGMGVEKSLLNWMQFFFLDSTFGWLVKFPFLPLDLSLGCR